LHYFVKTGIIASAFLHPESTQKANNPTFPFIFFASLTFIAKTAQEVVLWERLYFKTGAHHKINLFLILRKKHPYPI